MDTQAIVDAITHQGVNLALVLLGIFAVLIFIDRSLIRIADALERRNKEAEHE